MLKAENRAIVLRALHTKQGDNIDVYAFFCLGADIARVADISRITKDVTGALDGFQRPEIKQHVEGIAAYLNQGKVLFPNAIILALSPEVKFIASRGTKPTGDHGISQTGTLTLPIYEEGNRIAWIVDGQQRSIALSRTNAQIAVPVVGFVSESISMQREQFILVNKVKPLPSRLINELLPETDGILLPRDLTERKVPSELCNLLNRDPASPFFGLIKRASDRRGDGAIVTDTALIQVIRHSMNNQLGALSPYKSVPGQKLQIEMMYRILLIYWTAVKSTFPEAWGKDTKKSRLMHSAGILAMGLLMDRIYARLPATATVESVATEIAKIAPMCRWTGGNWDDIGVAWNEIQNTPQDVKRLQNALVRAHAKATVE